MQRGDFFYFEPAVRRRRSEVRLPWITISLAASCTILFFASLYLPLNELFSFVPLYAFSEPWTFVTSIFMHASFEHLFFNMFALFIFGMYLETRVKPWQYLAIFFIAGILGNFAYLATDPTSTIPGVGASGAIYGVMGMLAVLYPGLIVYVYFVPMPMIFAAVLWFVLEFTGLFIPSDIAHQAHIAGLLAGAAYGWYLRQQRKKPIFFWER
jgi:uncharacterized protein